MSLKLKITLGVLLAIAGFLVVRLILFFNQSLKTSANISSAISEPEQIPQENLLNKDSDHDGLPDREEIIYGTDPFNPDTDGDGYKDGEEIAAGYDPLDSSSNPKTAKKNIGLVSSSANLTDRVLNLGVASLVNDSGELDPSQMDQKKFADIMQSVNNEAELSLAPFQLTDSDIKISTDNGPAAITKYINSATQILEEGLFAGNTLGTDINHILGISDPTSLDYYQKKYNELKTIEVPSSWKEIHKSTLLNFNKLSNASRALTDNSVDNDPVKASFALTQVQQAFLALHDLLNEASRLAKSQNIEIKDSILDAASQSSAKGTVPPK